MDQKTIELLLETLSIRKGYFLDNIRLLENENAAENEKLITYNNGIIDGIAQAMDEIKKARRA